MKIRQIALLAVSALLCATGSIAEAQTKVLPLGDSVTSSLAPYSSYRYWLWQKLVQKGYNVDFVGTQWGVGNGAPENGDFDQNHEGHSGWTTSDAVQNIDSIAAAAQADVVLIDLGSNDVLHGFDLEETKQNLGTIIEAFRAVNPNVVILLAQPSPYQGPNSKRMSKLKGMISKVAKLHNQRESRVYVVNLFGGFNVRKDTFDGQHPDESGELKIAGKYFKVLRKVLP